MGIKESRISVLALALFCLGSLVEVAHAQQAAIRGEAGVPARVRVRKTGCFDPAAARLSSRSTM